MPVVLPPAPHTKDGGIYDLGFRPRLHGLCRNFHFDDLVFSGPGRSEDGVAAAGGYDLTDARTRNGGFDLHLQQWATDGQSIFVVPVTVVGCLPVALKRFIDSPDGGEPFDRCHTVAAGYNCPHGISVVARDVFAVHLVSEQYVLRFGYGETARIGYLA